MLVRSFTNCVEMEKNNRFCAQKIDYYCCDYDKMNQKSTKYAWNWNDNDIDDNDDNDDWFFPPPNQKCLAMGEKNDEKCKCVCQDLIRNHKTFK